MREASPCRCSNAARFGGSCGPASRCGGRRRRRCSEAAFKATHYPDCHAPIERAREPRCRFRRRWTTPARRRPRQHGRRRGPHRRPRWRRRPRQRRRGRRHGESGRDLLELDRRRSGVRGSMRDGLSGLDDDASVPMARRTAQMRTIFARRARPRSKRRTATPRPMTRSSPTSRAGDVSAPSAQSRRYKEITEGLDVTSELLIDARNRMNANIVAYNDGLAADTGAAGLNLGRSRWRCGLERSREPGTVESRQRGSRCDL